MAGQRHYRIAWFCVAAFYGVPTDVAQTRQADLGAIDKLMYHGGRVRLGWNALESVLTPATVAGPAFGPLWDSPALDAVTIDGQSYPARIYASPLYVDSLQLSAGTFSRSSVIFTATSNGYVYAIHAFGTGGAAPAGAILWSRRLGTPGIVPKLDGGVPLGILGTPAIDLCRVPPRMYVACADATAGWQVFALNIADGSVLPGWPLAITDSTLAGINQNGPARFQAASAMSQRGALNLSPDGAVLYVPFGSYGDEGAGWMVAVETDVPRLAAAFSGAASSEPAENGGMWSAGGPAVDSSGLVYDTTGNSPVGSADAKGVWGQSLLVWDRMLHLVGTYTPFDYCQWDTNDIDLGGSSPVLVPDIDPKLTSTTRLVAFGSKQGSVYLVDRDHLPGRLDRRPPCSTDATTDRSLVPPGPQPQFGTRGPLQVFEPYSEQFGSIDLAKMRSTAAYFQGSDGAAYLFVSGSTKAAADQPRVIPPSLVRLKIVTRTPLPPHSFVPPGSRTAQAIALEPPGPPAYLAIDAADASLKFLSPGSPVVTSNGTQNAMVWVLDANLFRSQPLANGSPPHPVLYAIDAKTLTPLWLSTQEELHVGGKYGTPVIAHGVVFVGTDRIQAFGLR